MAALDPGRAIRPNKADDAQAFGAPPVVATRHDEPVRSAEALEVAAGFDRHGLASRPDAEIRARSRRAPMSPSRNPCSGSRPRSSLALSLRWREPRS